MLKIIKDGRWRFVLVISIFKTLYITKILINKNLNQRTSKKFLKIIKIYR